MNRKFVRLASILAVFAALFALPLTADAASFKLAAILIPNEVDPDASGKAQWEFDTNDGRMKFRVDVEGITVDDAVTVLVDWQAVGFIELEDGKGTLSLDTQDGDVVKRLKMGQTVTIFSNSCWIVLEGKLKRSK